MDKFGGLETAKLPFAMGLGCVGDATSAMFAVFGSGTVDGIVMIYEVASEYIAWSPRLSRGGECDRQVQLAVARTIRRRREGYWLGAARMLMMSSDECK